MQTVDSIDRYYNNSEARIKPDAPIILKKTKGLNPHLIFKAKLQNQQQLGKTRHFHS